MAFKIVRNDITRMQVDAIVNTANSEPICSSGIDKAVYEAAGIVELLAKRQEIGYVQEGEVFVTSGYNLPAKYIIHAVSPCYIDGKSGEAEKLRGCYEKSLRLAAEYGCGSIAFPLISTGNFGYPKAEAMEIALGVIQSFLLELDMMVYLVVFDRESVKLSGQIYDDIELYIDDNYVEEIQCIEYCECAPVVDEASEPIRRPRCFLSKTSAVAASKPAPNMAISSAKGGRESGRTLEDLINNVGETFQQRLFRYIDEKGREDVEVYKSAGKDKKLFYKIKSNVNYQPSKHTVFAFALSLRLSLDETKDLLQSAGYAFSPSSKFDVIMQYVIDRRIYDIYKVDCILFDCGVENYFGCE